MSFFTTKVALLRTRLIIILSLVGLVTHSSYAFQQAPSTPKKKYEFTDARVSEADTLLKKRQYAQALEAYEKAYTLYESEGFYEGMVYAKERMAETNRRARKFSDAASMLEESMNILDSNTNSKEIIRSRVYLTKGLNAYSQRNYQRSSRFIDTSMNLYNKSLFYDSALVKSIIDYKFYTYFFSSQSRDTMIKYLNERGRYYDAKGSELNQQVYLLSDYSRAFFSIGDFQKGVTYALEGVRICEESGEDIPSAPYRDVLFNLSRQLVSQREYDRALSVTEKLISFTEANEPKNFAILGYYNLKAVILNGLERYDKAVEEFKRIINVFESNKSYTAFYRNTLLNLGVAYQLMGEYKQAQHYLEIALSQKKAIYKEMNVALTPNYNYLGQYYNSINQYRKALLYYDSALRCSLLSYRGNILDFPNTDFTGNYRTLDLLRKKQIGIQKFHESLGKDSLELLTSVLGYAESTHTYISENREELQANQGKLFLSENFKNLYESGLDAAYELHKKNSGSKDYLANGLSFMAHSKSILFQEQSGELGFVQDSRLPQSVKTEYYNIKKDIENLEEQFNSELDLVATNEALREINSELMRLNSRLDSFKDSVLSQVVSQEESMEVPDNYIRDLTDYFDKNPNKAVIEFFLGEHSIYMICLSKTARVFEKIPLTEKLQSSLSEIREIVSFRPSIQQYQHQFDVFLTNASFLYEELLSKAVNSLEAGVDELTIVPDGQLSQLPFEVLLYSKGTEAKYYYELNFLIKKYIINYSLTTSEFLKNPSLKSSANDLFAIGYSGSSASDQRSSYGGLPGTEAEVRFLSENVSGDFFLGESGDKNTFLQKARDYDILHLAVHGEADSLDRYQSKLIFNGKDGVLKTNDLYISDLKARLAILSACESGTGKINKGEGTFSIARGFALVGVPSIVMSLWKVNDQTASDLMVTFHKKLQTQLSVNTALSEAKLEFIKNSDEYTSHPYYWSAFVSLGEEVKVYDTKSRDNTLLIITLSIMMLTAIYLIRKRKGPEKEKRS